MSRAKAKGKYLETLVAKLIREEWGLSEFEVHRNQTSGVFSTEFGDIYFKDLDIIIECKNQESWDLKHILFWQKPITDWWQQLLKDVNLFIQKKQRKPIYFLVVGKSHYPKFAIFDKQSLTSQVLKQSVKISQILNMLDSYIVIENTSKNRKYCCELQAFIKSLHTFIF